jgi:hypothetical protein
MAPSTLLRVTLVAAWLISSRNAAADQPFVQVVEMHYGISSLPESQRGCRLCHIDDNGGAGNFRDFGLLIRSLGVTSVCGTTSACAAELGPALNAVDSQYPALAADIKAGRDPNPDVSAVTNVPEPSYGCALSIAARRTPFAGWVALLVGGLLTLRRRRAA